MICRLVIVENNLFQKKYLVSKQKYKNIENILHQTLDDTIEKQVEEKEYSTVLKEEEKLTVRLEDMGMGRKKKLGSGSDISKEERIACEEAQGLCANLLVAVSLLLVFATLPLSLCFVIKVVQARVIEIKENENEYLCCLGREAIVTSVLKQKIYFGKLSF